MPASEKQVEANRRNALKSTGPRTAEGKARSRLNAIVHGLSGTLPSTSAEDAAMRTLLREQLLEEWQPGSAMEVMLIDQIVETYLRLRRTSQIETEVIESRRSRLTRERKTEVTTAQALASDLSDRWGSDVEKAQRYENRLSRQWHRLLQDLRTLQRDRALRDAQQAAIGETNPIPAEPASPTLPQPTLKETGETKPISSEPLTTTGDANALPATVPATGSAIPVPFASNSDCAYDATQC